MPLPKIKRPHKLKRAKDAKTLSEEEFLNQLRQANNQPVKRLVKLVKIYKNANIGDDLTKESIINTVQNN